MSALDLSLSGCGLFSGGGCELSVVDEQSLAPLLPATTFMPVHYEQGYAYPLLVWLHGEGQSDADLPTVMKHISLRNYVAVAPRCEPLAMTAGGVSEQQAGNSWVDTTDAVFASEQRIDSAIALAEMLFNVRPNRVFLAGMGSGGSAALRIGLANPAQFAGVASFYGGMPQGNQPLRNINQVRRLPLMLASASDSEDYPQPQVCEDLSLLHTAGCQVNVRQYPGNDGLSTKMLSDLDHWMMQIVCNG